MKIPCLKNPLVECPENCPLHQTISNFTLEVQSEWISVNGELQPSFEESLINAINNNPIPDEIKNLCKESVNKSERFIL